MPHDQGTNNKSHVESKLRPTLTVLSTCSQVLYILEIMSRWHGYPVAKMITLFDRIFNLASPKMDDYPLCFIYNFVFIIIPVFRYYYCTVHHLYSRSCEYKLLSAYFLICYKHLKVCHHLSLIEISEPLIISII